MKSARVFKQISSGDMAPWYYDRLIDPLLSLIAHVDDEHLRASAICSLADLIKACRGRKIEKNIDEAYF